MHISRLSSDKACNDTSSTLYCISAIIFGVHHVATMSPRYNAKPGVKIVWGLPLEIPVTVFRAFAFPKSLSAARINGAMNNVQDNH